MCEDVNDNVRYSYWTNEPARDTKKWQSSIRSLSKKKFIALKFLKLLDFVA